MKLRGLISVFLCIFTFAPTVDAMSFSKPDDFVNSQYTNTSNNSTIFGLSRDIQQLKKKMNSRMIQFHRGLQSFESDVFTQTMSLRHHFWQLELIADEQLSKQFNIENEQQNSGLNWPQMEIGSEKDEPLFNLRLNVQQVKTILHRQIAELIQDVNQLNRKSSQWKTRMHRKRTFKLNQDVEQFNLTVDEHLFGLHNDVKRLESIVEEQIFELRQDVDSLKAKIDVSLSKLRQSLTAQTMYAPDLQQSLKTNICTSWQTLRQYVQCLDMISSRNMLGIRQEVSLLRTVIYEDVSSLHQNARSLQTDVCGEFSYKYNRFLRRR